MNWHRWLAEALERTGDDPIAVAQFNAEVDMLNWPHALFCERFMKFKPQHEPEVPR